MINNLFIINRLSSHILSILHRCTATASFYSERAELKIFFDTSGHNCLSFKICRPYSLLKTEERNADSLKNWRSVIREIEGLQLRRVYQARGDRIICLDFGTKMLVFKLFGSAGNVGLYDKLSKELIWSLRSNIEQTLPPNVEHGEAWLSTFIEARTPISSFEELSQESPELRESSYFREVLKNGWEELDAKRRKVELGKAVDELQSGKLVLQVEKGLKPSLSLRSTPNNAPDAEKHAFGTTINRFYNAYSSWFELEEKKKLLLSKRKNKIRGLQNSINKKERRLRESESALSNALIGHLIMSHLNSIKKGMETVSLNDFEDVERVIKLKKDLSPVQNAERYYRKSKNEHLQKEQLLDSLKEEKERMQSLLDETEKIELAVSYKDLKKFDSKTSERVEQKETSKFRKFEYLSFKILVGKSAKSNDDLIKIANKDDLWFHARDVAGSHVLIRCGNQKVPKEVIEAAAKLAVFYSKARGRKMHPVVYTQRKHIYKPKGAAPGKVIVKREEVLFADSNNPFER